MAFKMKRSGMQLRSTTRVAPQLTKYSSPFHNEENPAIIEASYDTGGDLENFELDRDYEGGGGDNPAYLAHKEKEKTDPCYQYKAGRLKCPEGTTLNPEGATPGNRDTCCARASEGGESGDISASESLEVNEPGTSMRPLTNREVRMNMRMINRGAAREGRLVAAANRRIRKAIRRGTPINPSDEAIVSGQALGQLDPNFNPYLHTSGSKSIYTGMQRGAQNFESGGRDDNYNAQVQSAADKMMAEKGYKKNADGKYDFGDMSQEEGQKILDQTISDAKASVDTSSGSGSGREIYAGQFLNDRTKRLARRKGFKSGGSLGNLASQNDQLKAQKLQKKLDTNKEMSDKRRKRIQKRIKKKGGTKKTPAKMSIEITRPSYKMKGFGK